MIRLENVSKIYDEAGQPRTVLKDVTASFADGEVAAVRGRSGSGKTTLLNLIAGIDSPSRGEIYVDDLRLTGLTPRRRTLFRRDNIGIVFQFFNLIPTLTVHENVILPAELAGEDRPEAVRRTETLLERVGLLDRKNEFPDRLSGGEQQRVAIARAMVRNPRFLLADEPTGSLDGTSGDAILRLLSSLAHESHKILILVTHSHRVAETADRTLVVEDGRLLPAGDDC